MKICGTCNIEKQDDDFYSHHKCGLQSSCKKCKSEYNKKNYIKNSERRKKLSKEWRQSNYAKSRSYNLGCDSDDIQNHLDSSDGYCSICRSSERLVIDHCHDTNKVRGILCNNCNVGLGFFKDDIVNLIRASKYLGRVVSSNR